MTPETAVPVREKKRTSGLPLSDRRDDLGDRTARTGHDWPHGHPRVDMIDLDDRLSIKTELPDMKRDDIDLCVEDRDLVIYGARHVEDDPKDDCRPGKERGLESFLRRIPMPFVVTADDIQANFDNSVLRVEVRKPTGTQPKNEKINVR